METFFHTEFVPILSPHTRNIYFSQQIHLILDSSLSYNDRGVVYYRMRDFTSALSEYDIATKLDPQDPVIRTNRADVLVELQKKDEAFSEYNHALSSNNKSTHV